MIRLTKSQVEEAINNSISMAEAAAKLRLHFNTFKRLATKYGIYTPNQGGKGGSKPRLEGRGKIPLEDIFNGLHPQYNTNRLKKRILLEGLMVNVCVWCGISAWNDRELVLELDHIDGNRCNHRLENLRLLCPNCHSQTDTFTNKRR